MSVLIGKKIGMTQVFDEKGTKIPVTVIQAGPCLVRTVKTQSTDGYNAVQLGFGDLKKNSKKRLRLTAAEAGHNKKVGVTASRVVKEFRLDDVTGFTVGQKLDVGSFDNIKLVDVTGISIGKGFQGVVKRHGFHGGPGGHGSNFHRRMGSAGSNTFPARVWKGKRMPGRMGAERVTLKNLQLVLIDKENATLIVKGSIPGGNFKTVFIRQAKG